MFGVDTGGQSSLPIKCGKAVGCDREKRTFPKGWTTHMKPQYKMLNSYALIYFFLMCGPQTTHSGFWPEQLSSTAELFSHVQHFETPWTVACQAPLSMGILQAGIPEWVAMPSSRRSSQARGRTQASCVAGRFFTIWATREAPQALLMSIKIQNHWLRGS